MDESGTLTVGAVARMAGVTVRTLHHYDAIGLLRPSGRSEAGYRRYTAPDIARLQRILFYRELEIGLDQIKDAMADGSADALDHQHRQHALLQARIERLQRLSDAVARAMEAHQMGIDLTPQERLEVFGDFEPEAYAGEVEERWGDTDAYRESARRTARYEADWQRIGAEGARCRAPGGGDAPGSRPTARRRWRRRGTPPPRRRGVLRVLAGCTSRWARCTSRTRGSRPPTTPSRRACRVPPRRDRRQRGPPRGLTTRVTRAVRQRRRVPAG
jgi:DNA-binding transcriptional MerR regulator